VEWTNLYLWAVGTRVTLRDLSFECPAGTSGLCLGLPVHGLILHDAFTK
jgi:hypothetical protein